MPNYSIKDLENLTGVQAHTIRIWEQRYRLLAPQRTPTNIRVYEDKDLRKLLSIALLNSNGLKISKAAKLTDAEVNAAVLKLTESANESVATYIETLKLIMIEMNESKFEKFFSHLVVQFGFEETISKVFVPFFARLTYLWQTESVTAAQIYFISSLYKQKLYVAFDGLEPANPAKKNFVFFLPKTEWTDNGLLFGHFLVRKRGYNSIYIGMSMTADDMIDVVKTYPNSYFVSVATLAKIDVTEYYKKILASCTEGQHLLISGHQSELVRLSDPKVTFFRDMIEFKTFVDSL
ncbi:MAG: MerR family transcriptional regulator [Bacteroidales bacterium]|jgi:DNA-binding transcriptional MerR regulator|nr:MerR family transcriptional regulator [Bacteroidales bacterium]